MSEQGKQSAKFQKPCKQERGKESSRKDKCIVTGSKIDKRYIGLKEAAEYLGLAKKTLYNWVWQRKIDCYKSSKKKISFRIDKLDDWMEKHLVPEEHR